MDNPYTKVYGWTEANECSYGVGCFEVITPSFNEDGLMTAPNHHGIWYRTFRQAKKQNLIEVHKTIALYKEIAAKVRGLKKSEVF